MARSKGTQDSTSSVYWKPDKPGEKVEGVFEKFSVSEFKDGKETRKALSIWIGGKSVNVSSVLHGYIYPVYKKLRPGKDKIKIVFTGFTKRKSKTRNPARLFDVWLNGKQLESEGTPAKEASRKDLESFFDPF